MASKETKMLIGMYIICVCISSKEVFEDLNTEEKKVGLKIIESKQRF